MSDRKKMLLDAVKGNQAAADFLDTLIAVLHLWDDLSDKDHAVADDDIDRAFWAALVEIPANPFYRRHFDALNPILCIAIQNWHGANQMERNGSDTDKEIAYILRSAYVDLITQSALIVGGYDWAREVTPIIRRFTHSETFTNYLLNLDAEKAARGNHEQQT